MISAAVQVYVAGMPVDWMNSQRHLSRRPQAFDLTLLITRYSIQVLSDI